MGLILPSNPYRLEARLSNAMTKLSGVDWCIPQHVRGCDFDIIERTVDVVIRDSIDGSVTRFFSAFYRDDTASEFLLLTVGPTNEILTRRLFENCTVVRHRVSTVEANDALLTHSLSLHYENLVL